MSRKSYKNKKYTPETKDSVVKVYLAGEWSLKYLSMIWNIKSQATPQLDKVA